MDIQAVLNGGYDVRNPNHNNKSKKGKAEPIFSKTEDMGLAHPFVRNTYKAQDKAYMFDADEYKKYIDAGISLNNWETTDSWDRQLAERQSAFKKIGNSLAQAVVSETVLGTLKGISDLFDFVTGATFRENNDYSNPVSEKLEEWQETFRNETAPIYTTPGVNISNGGLTDVGWWASNFPSVMSSLTLLIPSTGVTKGLSWLGKAANIASKGKIAGFGRKAYRVVTGAGKANTIQKARELNSVTKFLNRSSTKRALGQMVETGTNALLMRTMENYQEARQVYGDTKDNLLKEFENPDFDYDKFIQRNQSKLEDVDTNDKEAVANRISSQAADVTFSMDYANTLFDVFQLYALRNPLKLAKNVRATAKVKAANRQAVKDLYAEAGISEEKIKESLAKNYGRSTAEWLSDRGFAIKAELSEGAEEAINYIAQEEGMHYGNVALGKEKDSSFDTRLNSYLTSPELYDAAFWGVMGGVVFQGLGSGFNRLANKAEAAYEKSKRTPDEKTKEAINDDDYSKFETSENKRRVGEVKARGQAFELLSGRMQQILKSEVDPYSDDGKGNKVSIAGDEAAKNQAMDRAVEEYITGMTFRAMDAGNYNMLKDYLRNEVVQKALNNVTGNNYSGNELTEALISKMDKIAETYEDNLTALNNISSAINIKGSNYIPAEYLQIIARDNTVHQLAIERLDKSIADYEAGAEELKTKYASLLDGAIDYKSAASLAFLTHQLGLNKQHLEELKSRKDQGVDTQIAIQQTEEDINTIQTLIARDVQKQDMSRANQLATLLYSVVQSNTYLKDNTAFAENLDYIAQGQLDTLLEPIVSKEEFKDFKATDEDILTVLGEDRRSGQYHVLSQQVNQAFNGEHGLKKIDGRLTEYYGELARLNLEKALHGKQIHLDDTGINTRVNELHNTMLDARREAISQSMSILKEIGRQYGRENIYNYLYTGDESFIDNDNDKAKLRDAMEVLNLTAPQNHSLSEIVKNVMLLDSLEDTSKEAANKNNPETGEENTTSQNSVSAVQQQNLNNQSAVTPQTNISQGNTSNGNDDTIVSGSNDTTKITNNVTSYDNADSFRTITNPDTGQLQIMLYDKEGNLITVEDVDEDVVEQLTDNPQNALQDYINRMDNATTQDENDAIMNEAIKSGIPEKDIMGAYNRNAARIDKEKRNKNVLHEPTNIVAGTLVETLEKENIEKLNNEQIDDYIKQIDDAIESGKIVSDYNRSKLNVFRGVLSKKRSTNSPTGGVKGSKFDDNGQPIPDASIEAIKSEISGSLVRTLKEAAHNNQDVTEALNKTIKELNDKYGNDDEFKTEINRISNSVALLAQKKGWISDVANIVVLAASVEERGGEYKFAKEQVQQIEEFVDKYLKAINAKSINGKTIVSLEDVLRFANEQFSDPNVAEFIYGMMKGYFELDASRDGKKDKQGKALKSKYIVVDNMNSTNLVERSKIMGQDYIEQRAGGSNIHRVNTDTALEYGPSKAEYDKLNVGDSLTPVVADNGDVELTSNGVIIGTLHKPNINKNTGNMYQVNDGWVTEVSKNGDNVESPLKEIFRDILLNDTPLNNKINTYIYQLIAARNKGLDISSIYTAIREDKEVVDYINKLKADSIVDENAKIDKLFNHLANIWNYLDLTNPDKEQREKDVDLSLTLWFDKLYDSYSTIYNLSNAGTDGINISITRITDGDVIQVVYGVNDENERYEKSTIGKDNEAFANADEVEIGVIPKNRTGVIETTDGNEYMQASSGVGTVWAVFPNRSGIPGIISGHSLKFVDKDSAAKGTDTAEILNDVEKEIRRRIDRFINNNEIEELEEFINDLLSGNNNTSLLTPLKGSAGKFNVTSETKNPDVLRISGKINDKDYVNFRINRKTKIYDITISDGKNTRQQPLTNFADDFVNYVLGNSRINFDFKFFESDKNTTVPLSGLVSRDNGDFVITIPNGTDTPFVKRFSSFKEFITTKGAGKWNTKNENGSNYKAKSDTSQLRNRVLNVSITRETTRPVEESVTSNPVDDINNGTIIEKLLTRVFTNGRGETNKASIERLQKAGLIPGTIGYTDTIENKGGNPIYARYNTRTKQITVNDRWIELYNTNPERALRILIHERLHQKLREKGNRRKELLNRIEEVYNDFKKSLEQQGVDEHLKEYLFSSLSKEEALEEFIVESLTNRELATYLNNTTAEALNNKTKKSIYSKILEILADIFNWGIKEGSLYEKELKVLQGFTQEEINDSTKLIGVNNTINQLNEYVDYAGQHIKFDKETHTYYVDGKKVDYSVTQYAGEVYGKPNIEGDYSHSSAIGTTMDTIYRDFFNIGDDVLNKKYPNLNDARKQEILRDLHRLQEYLDDRFGKGEYTVITNEFPIVATADTPNGPKTIAGTIDMLVVDKEGNFHIFDFKAKNHPITKKYNGKEVDDRRNYTAQLNMYRAILESLNPEFKDKVKSLQLIWMDTAYPSIRQVEYKTDKEGNITIDGHNIENDIEFVTPSLDEEVENSIIPLEMSNKVEQLEIPNMTKIESTNEEVEENDNEDLESFYNFDEDSFDSSVEEINIEEIASPTVNTFSKQLPLNQQDKFDRLVKDGIVSTRCR